MVDTTLWRKGQRKSRRLLSREAAQTILILSATSLCGGEPDETRLERYGSDWTKLDFSQTGVLIDQAAA